EVAAVLSMEPGNTPWLFLCCTAKATSTWVLNAHSLSGTVCLPRRRMQVCGTLGMGRLMNMCRGAGHALALLAVPMVFACGPKAARDLSAANVRRLQPLRASGFISAAALDDARTQLKRDEAQVAAMEASVATARLPARENEIRAAEADARAAREVLAQADWRL